ncbi:MAG: exodeoxyribonuclease VII large subunit [Paraglaciecola sp.]|jgi:exodeoxyribonuclease VII large subunit
MKDLLVMFSSTPANRNIFTVSKLNHLVRCILESEIGQIWLSAEISNFVAASSGHWYFTLKDNRAQVKGAMFKGANRKVISAPKNGDKVLVRANLSLYEPRGDYQLIVEHLEPEGEGQLKLAFEQLKIKLAAQGLFAQQHKKSLPQQILRVGIVTSATGAALHDILTVLKRRNPGVAAIIYPTMVQGDNACAQICRAIQLANTRAEVDILIVGRGGGSLEDLWCFNEEQLALAIYASTLPIVSAVGHEVDITIADFVADIRAPTPSAAAELVCRDKAELLTRIKFAEEKLLRLTTNLLKELTYQQQANEHKLQKYHPKNQLQQHSQQIDRLQASLTTMFTAHLQHAHQRSEQLNSQLHLVSPKHRLSELQGASKGLCQRLQLSWQQLLVSKQQTLATNSHLLDTVSPLATLARGYSISYKGGEIVKSSQVLIPGDELTSRFVDGEVVSKVL